MSNNFNNIPKSLYAHVGGKYGMTIKGGGVSDQNIDQDSGKPTKQQVTDWDAKYLIKKDPSAESNTKNIVGTDIKNSDETPLFLGLVDENNNKIKGMSKAQLYRYRDEINKVLSKNNTPEGQKQKLGMVINLINEELKNRIKIKELKKDSIKNMRGDLLKRVGEKMLTEIEYSNDNESGVIKNEIEAALKKLKNKNQISENQLREVLIKHLDYIQKIKERKQNHSRNTNILTNPKSLTNGDIYGQNPTLGNILYPGEPITLEEIIERTKRNTNKAGFLHTTEERLDARDQLINERLGLSNTTKTSNKLPNQSNRPTTPPNNQQGAPTTSPTTPPRTPPNNQNPNIQPNTKPNQNNTNKGGGPNTSPQTPPNNQQGNPPTPPQTPPPPQSTSDNQPKPNSNEGVGSKKKKTDANTGSKNNTPSDPNNNPDAVKNIRTSITNIRERIQQIRKKLLDEMGGGKEIKDLINEIIGEYNTELVEIINIRKLVDDLKEAGNQNEGNRKKEKKGDNTRTSLSNDISGLENTINGEIEKLQKYIGTDAETLIKEKMKKPEEKLVKFEENIKAIEQKRIEISKEVEGAWKDGEIKKAKLSDEDIEIFTADYNLVIEDIDNEITKLNELQNKLTPVELAKIGNKIPSLILKLKAKRKSIEKAILNLRKKDCTEQFKKIEKAIEENNKKMEEIESLTKQMTTLSQKSAQVEGKNAGIRFLKKFGAITYTAEDRLNWVTMVAKRAMLVKQVGNFYRKSLKGLYDIDATGKEVDKKREMIKSVKEIREKMYLNKSNRFNMVMKNILVSTSLEVGTAFTMGEIKVQKLMDAVSDSFSPDKDIRSDARGALIEAGMVGGAVAGAFTGGLSTIIGGAVLGNVGARLGGAANDAYFKRYAQAP